MERLVQVSDKKGPSFRVFLGLHDLLLVLEPESRGWTWAVQRMPEMSLVRNPEFDLRELEAWVRRDPDGLVLDHERMTWFDRQVDQVIWGEFVAAGTRAALPGRDDPDELVGERALAGLFAFDSSFWLVGGPAAVIDRIAARFDQVEDLDPREWVRDPQ